MKKVCRGKNDPNFTTSLPKKNVYQKRQEACDCLPAGRREFIRVHMDIADDFSDGAFMAYMGENGIDISELEALSLDHDCQKIGGEGC